MKIKKDYIELTFSEFKRKFPEALKEISNVIPSDIFNDSNYIVRLRILPDATVGVEIGYSGDVWRIA